MKPPNSIVVECHFLAQALGINLAQKIHMNFNKWNPFIILDSAMKALGVHFDFTNPKTPFIVVP
jgi:hypothetical protein